MATEPQIINFYNNKDTCLSKMKKPDLYKKCQELIRENMKLQMINNVQQEEIETLKKSQICCDCQVGGECEAPGNCANGKRIEKLQEEIEDMKNDEKQFQIIEDLTEKLGDEVQKNIDLEKNYECLKSRHIECIEKLEIMNFIEEFVDITFRGEIDWFEPEVMRRFCEETLDHFPDNKELFLKCILCKYDIYCEKLYTYEEVEQFNVECQEEEGNEDFDIELWTEEEIIDYCEGQCSYIHKCEIDGVEYYVLFE